MRIFLAILSVSLCILTACRVDPEIQAFEGTYSGTLLIDEQSWRYEEGIAQQDTLYSTAYFFGPTTVTFEKDKYTSAYQSGFFAVSEGTVSFIADPDPVDCPLDTTCISFFHTFPQYPFPTNLRKIASSFPLRT